MSAIVTHAVNELPDSERRSLENLLGCELDADQQVCVMAFAPTQVPEENVRMEAIHRIRDRLDAIDRYQAAQRVEAKEVDAAIDEAMDRERLRSS